MLHRPLARGTRSVNLVLASCIDLIPYTLLFTFLFSHFSPSLSRTRGCHRDRLDGRLILLLCHIVVPLTTVSTAFLELPSLMAICRPFLVHYRGRMGLEHPY